AIQGAVPGDAARHGHLCRGYHTSGHTAAKRDRRLGGPGDPPSWAAIEQLSACEEESRTMWHHLFLVCQGDEELLELFHQNTQAGLHPPPPMAGVALPLAPAEDDKWVPCLDAGKGKVFCQFLMLVISGLPIHLHGAFSVLSNHKGLWDPVKQGKWNQVLLHIAMLMAWLQALYHLCAMHKAGKLKNYEYHLFWPDISTARCGSQEWPEALFLWCSWCLLHDIHFLHQAVERCPKLVPHPLLAVAFPGKVQGLRKVLDAGTSDWNHFVCELVLLPNLTNLPTAEQNLLLLHALDMSHEDVDKVLQKTVPCIPVTPHGHLQFINHLRLGMVKNTMALPDLLEKAKTLQLVWTKNCAQGCQRAACILELLQDAVKKRANNTLWATFQTVPFLPAALPMLYHHLHAPLVVIHPILAPKALRKNFSLSKEVASFLGLDQQIPSAPVLKLQALSCSSSTLPLETLQDSNNCCYKHLNVLLWEHRSSWDEVASAVAQGEPFILVGSHFVPVTAVAETLSFEAVPYLSSKSSTRPAESSGKTHAGQLLPASELDLTLQLVSCSLIEDGNQPDACQTQQLFLPDEEALCCGVATTCHRALERSELITDHLSLWVQPSGAHEDLPTQLKNIFEGVLGPCP
ncbi:Sacsin, partial [Lamprotornis superbus]